MTSDIGRMWRLLRLSRWRVAVSVGWGVLALGSGLGLAALAAWLIARAWQMPPVLDLTVAVVAVRALGISRGLCRYLERLATHDVALRAMTEARASTYRALARSPLWLPRRDRHSDTADGTSPHESASDAARLRRGDVLVRMGSDIDDLGAVVVRAFVPIVVAVVLAVAAVALLAVISPAAAVILAAALAVSGIAAPWLSARAAADAERAVRADRAEFTAQSMTVLDHAAELRVAGRLDDALAAAAAAGRRAVAAEDAAAARSASSAAAIPLSIGASVLGALLIGITLYGPTGGDPGAMSPMALAVLVLLPLSAFEAVGTLPAAAQTLTTARAALHRIEEVRSGVQATADNITELRSSTDAHPTRDTQRDSARTHAVPSDARSAYEVEPENPRPDAVPAVPLAPDTLVDGALIGNVGSGPWRIPGLPDARRIVIVGPSGAGKTTLLMAWAGLFDRPVPGVTFFAEDAHLFGTSVLENLRVARGDLGAAEAEQALRAVGLGAWLDSLPYGVHTDLVGGAAAVSGGQRRRILLARALISPARVLLLDEPTEHLEADTGAVLLRALLDADSGMVAPERQVVVVTHQLPVNHKADMVLRVDGSGQVRAFFSRYATAGATVREIPLPTGAAAD